MFDPPARAAVDGATDTLNGQATVDANVGDAQSVASDPAGAPNDAVESVAVTPNADVADGASVEAAANADNPTRDEAVVDDDDDGTKTPNSTSHSV